ncbi:methyltransferase domain-containing protein [Pseudomonas sp. CCM 7893]|uniref:Methyltransferase domain-containing protein n=1 Tax=Pseudomonas spelaei TaxID=1055469 RepID=A0A6I3W2P6_9PSED|nr:methyltransferase domain-containing protein [Pseudomonas spelaei]
MNKQTARTLVDHVYQPYKIIQGASINPYQERVVCAYGDSPENWRKAIGDALWFQFGVYDDPRSAQPITLDESGLRYFERQLKLAGFEQTDSPQINRILDVGCGWGSVLKYLAEYFPKCQHLDGVNISTRQLEHGAKLHTEQGLSDRIHLYQCNAQDIDLLPDFDHPYDLVIMRGVISHFPNDLYETVIKKLWQRTAIGGTIIISDNLYNVELEQYTSDIPDTVDRLACKHRKTPEYFARVLKQSGFAIQDMRVLPNNSDAIHWLLNIKSNIEHNFPEGITGALEELRIMCESLAVAIVKNKFSIYSTIIKRY